MSKRVINLNDNIVPEAIQRTDIHVPSKTVAKEWTDKKLNTVPLDEDWPKDGAPSITSPGCTHRIAAAYLAEVIMVHQNGTLPPQFWQTIGYKKSYQRLMMALNKITKNAGFIRTHKTIVENRISGLGHTFQNLLHKTKE
jgi:hypothetical protein